MENFRRVRGSIKPPVWSFASSPDLCESSVVGWAAVSGFVQPSTNRSRPSSHPPNWIQTNLATPRWTRPVDLILHEMICGSSSFIVHHYDTSVWLIERLSRTRVFDASLWYFFLIGLIGVFSVSRSDERRRSLRPGRSEESLYSILPEMY